MDILSKLPERLKELMFDRGINAPTLAEKLDVGANTITRYLQGVSTPNFDIFVKLIEYFNCSADFLLGLEEQPFYEKKYSRAAGNAADRNQRSAEGTDLSCGDRIFAGNVFTGDNT